MIFSDVHGLVTLMIENNHIRLPVENTFWWRYNKMNLSYTEIIFTVDMSLCRNKMSLNRVAKLLYFVLWMG